MKMFKNNMKWEGKLKFSFAFALTMMLFLSLFTISPSLAVDTPEIYLASSAVLPGLKWKVTAWVRNVPAINPVFAYQIALFFNTSFLECAQTYIPKSDKAWIFSELTTVLLNPKVDNVGGFAVVGDSILTGKSISGSGPFSLAVFEFHIKCQLDDDPLSYIKISIPDTCLINDTLKEVSLAIKTNNSTDSIWSHVSTKPRLDTPRFESSNSSNGIRELADSFNQSTVELIVGLNKKLSNAFTQLTSFTEGYDSEIADTISIAGEIVAVAVNVTLEQASLFESEVEKASFSTYVELNHRVRALVEPNDTFWSQQWGPKKIKADWAWNTTSGNASILVAVIDSGIDYNHTDLKDNYAFDEEENPFGYDWVNDDTDPFDDSGHGTHCAGIIAAVTNNSEGIAGLAQVRIMAEKVLDRSSSGTWTDTANGIINATDFGADIISMSFGGYFYSETLYSACKYALENGVLLVAAAGNEAISGTSFPAYFQEAIAVTATDQNDIPASFTNFGPWVELAAPGVDILSTMPLEHKEGPYHNHSGTSMACPHVAGVAALIWSQFPNLTRDQVRVHLRKTVDDLGPSGFDINYGYGRINAKNAVEQSIPEHGVLILDWMRTPYVKMGNVTVNSTILNYGANDESNVVVQLWRNGSMVTSKSIDYLQSGDSTTVELSCEAPSEGVYNITVCVVPVQGEADVADNVVWAYVGTEQGIIKVPDYYPTIQEGVDVADSGDTIQVSAGTYNEAVHIRQDNLSLIGESQETTVINGSGPVDGIWVVYLWDADNFQISRFKIQNSGHFRPRVYYDGLLIFCSDNSTITDNVFSNNYEGIYFFASHNTNITGNKIISCTDAGIAGVEDYPPAYNHISGNTIESNSEGIFISNMFGSPFSNDTITDNIVKGNDFGISIGARGTLITGNKVVENTYDGIGLDLGSWGYYNSTGNIVKDNHLRDNGVGININWATDNEIYWNNFVNNTDQVVGSLPNIWHGYWNVTGDYWSDYAGNNTDEDKYEIGDDPYVIDANNEDKLPLMDPYLPGDIKHDGKIDIYDVVIISQAYGSHGPPDPSQDWDPHADLDEDNDVDMTDIAIVTANYGETWQSYWDE